jgi:hypothetical protein
MNYYNKITIFFLFIPFICGFSQEIDSFKSQDESFLKKGKVAVVFELGSLINRSTTFEGYNFLVKYHINDNSAIRLNFRIGGGQRDDNDISNLIEFSSYDFDINANVQFYLSQKSFVKPFISFGPTFNKDHLYLLWSYDDNFSWHDEWGLGLMFTMGTEIFIHDNVSLIGEYLLKGTYSETKVQSYYGEYKDENIKEFKFSGNTARLGFSVYF